MARVTKPDDVAQMRRRLLHAAYEAVAECGFAAVTLQEIGNRANVSKALVLYYFKDKEHLLVSAMERTDEIIRARASRAVRAAAPDGPHAQMEAYLDALMVGAKEHRDFFHVYLDYLSAGLRNPEVRRSTLGFMAGCQVLECEVIERGIAEGIFRPDLVSAEAASVIHALIEGLSLQWVFASDEPFAHLRERLGAAIFGYLLA